MPLLPTSLETALGPALLPSGRKGTLAGFFGYGGGGAADAHGLLDAAAVGAAGRKLASKAAAAAAAGSSFLGGKAAATAAAAAASAPGSHSDFLFGGPAPTLLASRGASWKAAGPPEPGRAAAVVAGGARAAGPRGLFLGEGGAQLLPAGALAAAARKPSAHEMLDGGPILIQREGQLSLPSRFSPTLSMMGLASLDPFSDDHPDDGATTGWVKVVPKILRVFAIVDVLSCLVLYHTQSMDCEVPLKLWLLGGILLGFPVSHVVQGIASSNRPMMQWYRLTVTRIRGGGDPANFKIEGLMMYDQFHMPIDRIMSMREHQDLHYWCVEVTEGPQLLTAYQVITHPRGDPSQDPVCWTLEGSIDGVDWTILDEMEGAEVPRNRGVSTPMYEDLFHLSEATRSWHMSGLFEMVANAGAFAWLVAGTAWVNAGSEMCVDSAPHLWYYCYVLVVIVWSFLGTVTTGLILAAVWTVVFGMKAPG